MTADKTDQGKARVRAACRPSSAGDAMPRGRGSSGMLILAACAAAILANGAGVSRALRAADDPIPEPLSLSVFDPLFQNTPFRRILSLSDNLVLSGVAEVPGRAMVTVLNRATNETFVVSDVANAQGWKLLELRSDNDLDRVSAKILAGGQEVTLRFDPRRLQPEARRTDATPGRRTDALLVVEALLRRLDTEAAARFESLAPDNQEEFRKSFVDYLQAYPEAPDDERIAFVRDTLDDLAQRSAPEEGEAGAGGEEGEATDGAGADGQAAEGGGAPPSGGAAGN